MSGVGLGNGANACRFVVSHLKGAAFSWWRDFSKDNVDCFDSLELDVLFEALRRYFSDAD